MSDIVLPVRKFPKGSIDPRTGLACEGQYFVRIPEKYQGNPKMRVNLKTRLRTVASDRVAMLIEVSKIIDNKIGEF
jgi:hypothetical protein